MQNATRKRRGLSLALAVLLTFSILPSSPLQAMAQAADDPETIATTDTTAASETDPTTSDSEECLDTTDPNQTADNPTETSPNETTVTEIQADDQLDPLNAENLPDGTYTVSVSLRNASDLAQSSMAAGAIDNVDRLSVENGAYTLGLTLGTVQMGSITGYVKQIDSFASFTVQENKMQFVSEAIPAWTAKSQGDTGPAAFPIAESAKQDGYAAIQLYSDEMPVSPQKAALFIDWTTLQKIGDEPTAFDSDTSGAEKPSQTNGDTSATEEQTGEQTQPTDGESSAQSTTTTESFQVGHVYAVPIYFTKAGTAETSMASQYFGGTAHVRPLSNGTFDVRFSTNRPDYVESVSYNGSPATVTSSSTTSREFSINVPRSTSNTVVRLGFEITPMKELGAGTVSADMHLYLSRASDLGTDTGQVASASGGGNSLPSTGDPLAPAALSLTLAIAAAAIAASTARRKAFAHNTTYPTDQGE